jgi:tetratricopeptide (TPR) repeat protein
MKKVFIITIVLLGIMKFSSLSLFAFDSFISNKQSSQTLAVSSICKDNPRGELEVAYIEASRLDSKYERCRVIVEQIQKKALEIKQSSDVQMTTADDVVAQLAADIKVLEKLEESVAANLKLQKFYENNAIKYYKKVCSIFRENSELEQDKGSIEKYICSFLQIAKIKHYDNENEEAEKLCLEIIPFIEQHIAQFKSFKAMKGDVYFLLIRIQLSLEKYQSLNETKEKFLQILLELKDVDIAHKKNVFRFLIVVGEEFRKKYNLIKENSAEVEETVNNIAVECLQKACEIGIEIVSSEDEEVGRLIDIDKGIIINEIQGCLRNLSLLFYYAEDFEKAEKCFEKELEFLGIFNFKIKNYYKLKVDTYSLLIKVKIATGKYEESVQIVNKYLDLLSEVKEKKQEIFYTLYFVSDCFEIESEKFSGDLSNKKIVLEQAIICLEKMRELLDIHEDKNILIFVFYKLSVLYDKVQDSKKAEDVLEKLFEILKKVDTGKRDVLLQFSVKRISSEIKIFDKADICYKLAISQYNNKKYKKVLETLDESLVFYRLPSLSKHLEKVRVFKEKIRTMRINTYNQLLFSYEKQGKLKKIEETITELLKLYLETDKEIRSKLYLSRAVLRIKNKKRGAQVFIKKIKEDLDNVDMELLETNNKKQERTNWLSYLTMICFCYEYIEDYDKMSVYVEKALCDFSNQVEFLFYKAIAETRKGKFKEAIELLLQVYNKKSITIDLERLFIKENRGKNLFHIAVCAFNLIEEYSVVYKEDTDTVEVVAKKDSDTREEQLENIECLVKAALVLYGESKNKDGKFMCYDFLGQLFSETKKIKAIGFYNSALKELGYNLTSKKIKTRKRKIDGRCKDLLLRVGLLEIDIALDGDVGDVDGSSSEEALEHLNKGIGMASSSVPKSLFYRQKDSIEYSDCSYARACAKLALGQNKEALVDFRKTLEIDEKDNKNKQRQIKCILKIYKLDETGADIYVNLIKALELKNAILEEKCELDKNLIKELADICIDYSGKISVENKNELIIGAIKSYDFLIEKTDEIENKIKYSLCKCRALVLLEEYEALGNVVSALEEYNQSFLYKELSSSISYYKAVSVMQRVDISDVDVVQHFSKVIYSEKEIDINILLDACDKLVEIYKKYKDFDLLEILNKVLSLEFDDKEKRVVYLSERVKLNYEQNKTLEIKVDIKRDLKKAVSLYEKSKDELFKTEKLKRLIFEIYHVLGRFYLEDKDYEKAFEYFEKCLKVDLKLSFEEKAVELRYKGEAGIKLALEKTRDTQLSIGFVKKAIRLYDKAIEDVEPGTVLEKLQKQKQECYYILGWVYIEIGVAKIGLRHYAKGFLSVFNAKHEEQEECLQAFDEQLKKYLEDNCAEDKVDWDKVLRNYYKNISNIWDVKQLTTEQRTQIILHNFKVVKDWFETKPSSDSWAAEEEEVEERKQIEFNAKMKKLEAQYTSEKVFEKDGFVVEKDIFGYKDFEIDSLIGTLEIVLNKINLDSEDDKSTAIDDLGRICKFILEYITKDDFEIVKENKEQIEEKLKLLFSKLADAFVAIEIGDGNLLNSLLGLLNILDFSVEDEEAEIAEIVYKVADICRSTENVNLLSNIVVSMFLEFDEDVFFIVEKRLEESKANASLKQALQKVKGVLEGKIKEQLNSLKQCEEYFKVSLRTGMTREGQELEYRKCFVISCLENSVKENKLKALEIIVLMLNADFIKKDEIESQVLDIIEEYNDLGIDYRYDNSDKIIISKLLNIVNSLLNKGFDSINIQEFVFKCWDIFHSQKDEYSEKVVFEVLRLICAMLNNELELTKIGHEVSEFLEYFNSYEQEVEREKGFSNKLICAQLNLIKVFIVKKLVNKTIEHKLKIYLQHKNYLIVCKALEVVMVNREILVQEFFKTTIEEKIKELTSFLHLKAGRLSKNKSKKFIIIDTLMELGLKDESVRLAQELDFFRHASMFGIGDASLDVFTRARVLNIIAKMISKKMLDVDLEQLSLIFWQSSSPIIKSAEFKVITRLLEKDKRISVNLENIQGALQQEDIRLIISGLEVLNQLLVKKDEGIFSFSDTLKEATIQHVASPNKQLGKIARNVYVQLVALDSAA